MTRVLIWAAASLNAWSTLWLPKNAEIYFDFRKHRYYRRHSFDHYMLYSVDSEEKRKEPTVKPTTDAAEGKKPSLEH